MSDVLTWSQIGTIIAGISAVMVAWKIRQSDKREIDRKIDANTTDLMSFKLHVAELHPTAKELAQIENRLTASLDRLADRIDRLLDGKR